MRADAQARVERMRRELSDIMAGAAAVPGPADPGRHDDGAAAAACRATTPRPRPRGRARASAAEPDEDAPPRAPPLRADETVAPTVDEDLFGGGGLSGRATPLGGLSGRATPLDDADDADRGNGGLAATVAGLCDDLRARAAATKERAAHELVVLASSTEARAPIIEAGAVPLLCELLHDLNRVVREKAAHVLRALVASREHHTALVSAVGANASGAAGLLVAVARDGGAWAKEAALGLLAALARDGDDATAAAVATADGAATNLVALLSYGGAGDVGAGAVRSGGGDAAARVRARAGRGARRARRPRARWRLPRRARARRRGPARRRAAPRRRRRTRAHAAALVAALARGDTSTRAAIVTGGAVPVLARLLSDDGHALRERARARAALIVGARDDEPRARARACSTRARCSRS